MDSDLLRVLTEETFFDGKVGPMKVGLGFVRFGTKHTFKSFTVMLLYAPSELSSNSNETNYDSIINYY